MDLWNLNEETEVPVIKTSVGAKALNRLQWSEDGKKILTGDSVGSLFIYDTGEVIFFVVSVPTIHKISMPHTDEWQKFEETVLKLQIQQEDTIAAVNAPQQ